MNSVHDGDTVHVKLDIGFDLTVYARCRVYGINAPELNTPEGVAARDYARSLMPIGSDILVISEGWDKYGGRIDAELTIPDGRDVGETMIKSGHAQPRKY